MMTSAVITVVGGSYGEECSFPRRQIFRGSGMRAAALLSQLNAQVVLKTLVGPTLRPHIEAIAEQYKFTLHAEPKAEDIWFRYRHSLGQPTIYPPKNTLHKYQTAVTTETALVYGMLEGRPIIRARRAVYDPQDGVNAESFFSNGSTAEELVVIASFSEGKALTGENDPNQMAAILLQQSNVTAVVIKCGAQGALIQTQETKNWIRPFPSKNVYKIGSGDVFTAAFAFAWLLERKDVSLAAWFASRVTSAYVEVGHDRINPEDVQGYWADAQAAASRHAGMGPRALPTKSIYLAAPFFSTSQQWLVDEARYALIDMGFKVFSPVHDVGIGPPHEVAPQDLFGLEQSGLVLALLDGLDAGTIFEVGYARARNIPVVAIAEAVDENALTMIIGSGCEVTNNFATGIYAACWQLMGDV